MDLRFGQFCLKSVERELIGPGGPLDLAGRSFDILAILLEQADDVVSKAVLLERVWPDVIVEENTLQVHISALRRTLGEGMIATIHGRGYKYVGPRPVTVLSDPRPSANRSTDGEYGTPIKPSIAVLPFGNRSDDPGQEYFSDGITEDIISELGKFKEFIVIARNSSFQLRGAAVDFSDAARQLQVQYVVNGSVRKTGNRVRVSVQLIDASLSALVWGEHYDRELVDVFAIQDDITQTIATRLARQARVVIEARARSRPTQKMSAYERYLRALHLSSRYDYGSVCEAEPLLRQAVELDPEFAAARAMLGFVEILKFFWNTDKADLLAGLETATVALRLDPHEAYAHLAAGFAQVYLGQFREAEASLGRALSLNPNDPFILTINALLLHFTSRPDLALKKLDDAQRRDPFAVDWYGDFRGITLTAAGRYEEACACYAKLERITPWSRAYLAVCYAKLGQEEQGREELQKLRIHWPAETLDDIISHEMDYFEDPNVCREFRSTLKRLEKA